MPNLSASEFETGPIPLERHLVADPRVAAFYHEHGYDPWGSVVDWLRIDRETVESLTVVATDPLEVDVVVTVDGARLTARLDDEGRVVDVHR